MLKTLSSWAQCSGKVYQYSSASSSKMASAKENIVWIDMEMTGLDIEKDHLLEIACIITDSQLNILAENPEIIIHQNDDILKNMNDWCIQQHGESGLTKASGDSTIDVKTAENQILKFIKPFVVKGRSPLAGNSVYMDRLFLMKFMPNVNSYLHYRIIDVSTVKELSRRWYPSEFKNIPMKSFQHRCLPDIRESIEELKYYRQNVFK